MRLIASTGTDIAQVCFFDPGSLDKDFDTRLKRDAHATLKTASEAGSIYNIATGADGAYLFHFYVVEDAPPEVLKYSVNCKQISSFFVPTGTLYACGTEYLSTDPDKSLAKFPHMGKRLAIEPGTYSLLVHAPEWPEGHVEELAFEELGPWARKTCATFGNVMVASIVSAVILVLSLFTQPLRWLMPYMGLVTFLMISAAVCLKRSKKYKLVERKIREKEVDCPSIVVCMQLVS